MNIYNIMKKNYMVLFKKFKVILIFYLKEICFQIFLLQVAYMK